MAAGAIDVRRVTVVMDGVDGTEVMHQTLAVGEVRLRLNGIAIDLDQEQRLFQGGVFDGQTEDVLASQFVDQSMERLHNTMGDRSNFGSSQVKG